MKEKLKTGQYIGQLFFFFLNMCIASIHNVMKAYTIPFLHNLFPVTQNIFKIIVIYRQIKMLSLYNHFGFANVFFTSLLQTFCSSFVYSFIHLFCESVPSGWREMIWLFSCGHFNSKYFKGIWFIAKTLCQREMKQKTTNDKTLFFAQGIQL